MSSTSPTTTGPAGGTDTLRRRVWIRMWKVLHPYHRALLHRLYASRRREREIVDNFHRYYCDLEAVGGTYTDTYWLGIPTLKLPLDLWIYQELVHTLQPELIVETGTHAGGSALFLASMCDLVGTGRVLTIDIESRESRPEHPRITYLHGSSTSAEVIDRVRAEAAGAGAEAVLVVLDSDHSKAHVLAELEQYHRIVTVGSYLIVEDTHVNGHPIFPEHGPGPREAVDEFLAGNESYEVDRHCEKFLMSFNRGGYLRRVR